MVTLVEVDQAATQDAEEAFRKALAPVLAAHEKAVQVLRALEEEGLPVPFPPGPPKGSLFPVYVGTDTYAPDRTRVYVAFQVGWHDLPAYVQRLQRMGYRVLSGRRCSLTFHRDGVELLLSWEPVLTEEG